MSEFYNLQDAMYITTSSNVGIGITNPDKKLEVVGDIDTTTDYNINGTEVLSATTLGSGVVNSSLTSLGTQAEDLNMGSNRISQVGRLTFEPNDEQIKMVMTTSSATSGFKILQTAASGLITFNQNENADMIFKTNDTTRLTLDASGDIDCNSNNITNAADIAFTSLTMGGHMIPDTDDTYDIGSAEFKIRDLYVSDNSMWVGDSHKISISGGKMKFRKRKTTSVPAAITAAGGDEAGALGNSVGINSLADMKLRHWKAYMRTLADQSGATIQDIFTDNAEDYIEDSGSYNWLESGTKTFLTSGNVGIGTQDPAALLSLHYNPESSQGLKELLRLSWHDINYDTLKGDGTKISFHTSDTNNYPGTVEAGYFGVMKANAVEANTEADITIANNDGTNMVERIRILADGKVGVGDFSSSSPGYKLDVVGDINFTGSLYQNGSAFSSGEMNIWSESTVVATVAYYNDGNVGIGTTDPDDKLHIYENANDSIQLKIENDYASARAGLSLVNDGGTFNVQAHSGYAILENQGTAGTYFYQKGTGDFHFKTTDSNTTRLSILTDGNVGIGTNSPSTILEINTGSTVGGNTKNCAIKFNNWDAGARFVVWDNGASVNDYAGLGKTGSALDISIPSSGNFFAFKAAGTELLRIKGNGNVGIGRSPSYDLDVYRTGTNADFAVVRGDGAEIKLKAQDFQSRITYVGGDLRFDSDDTGTLRMILKSSGKVGIGTNDPSGLLDVKVRPETDYYATYNDMYFGSYLSIGYNRSGNLGYFGYNARLYTSITSATSAAGISMGGETGNWYKPVYAGHSTATMRIVVPYWNGSLYWKHHTHSYGSAQVKENLFTTDMHLDRYGNLTVGGDLNYTGDITDISDGRYKDNQVVVDYEECYNKVKQLDLKNYDWNEEIMSELELKVQNENGFVAQDVEVLMPDAVKQRENMGIEDFKVVNYNKINMYLFGAFKKSQEKIEELESELALIKSHLGL